MLACFGRAFPVVFHVFLLVFVGPDSSAGRLVKTVRTLKASAFCLWWREPTSAPPGGKKRAEYHRWLPTKPNSSKTPQKYLHQGKVSQAIVEYQQILKQEPKDQVTLMTIGDLFVRQGETFQALEYFERLASIYLADGFVTKAIAIYKKIAKLAPEETRPVERLAELYIQQGVLSEARPIYLQLAETAPARGTPAAGRGPIAQAARGGTGQPARANAAGRAVIGHGPTREAPWPVFRAAPIILHRRGDHAEAIKYADRALKIEPDDAATVVLKVRILAASGPQRQAVSLLEPGCRTLKHGGEPARLLLELLPRGRMIRPARRNSHAKIFARDTAKTSLPLLAWSPPCSRPAMPNEALVAAGPDPRGHDRCGRTRSSFPVPQSHRRTASVRIEPREWLVELYGRTSDSFRMPDALAEPGRCIEAAGKPRASAADLRATPRPRPGK